MEKDARLTISTITSVAAIVISLISLILGLFPQINPYNTDYLSKAKAGDVESQMFLANHYYEVGNISESLYWYQIAAMKEGEHQAKALNNIAYLYLNAKVPDEKKEEYNEFPINIYDKSLDLFERAGRLGEIRAVENMYILLSTCSEELSPSVHYFEKLDWAKKTLDDEGRLSDSPEAILPQWQYKESFSEEIIRESEGMGPYITGDGGTFMLWTDPSFFFTFNVYEKVSGTEATTAYIYIP